MRIVLSWGTAVPLQIWTHTLQFLTMPVADTIFFTARKNSTMQQTDLCSGCDSSDNATLNRDDQNGAPGTETIPITKISSAIYRYSVHDFTNRGTFTCTKLVPSGKSVKVHYNDSTTTFSVPNLA